MCPTGGREKASQNQNVNPDLIIKDALLVSMAEGQEPMQGTDLLVAGGRIVGICTQRERGEPLMDNVEIINAGGGIVMPGLINSHNHAAMTLFRGLADDLPLKQWLFEKIFPAEAKYLSIETVYSGALLACLEMIASGTTTFADGYFFQDATVKAVHESGLRALVAQGVIDFPAPGVKDPKENLNVAKAFIEKWLDFSDLIIPGMACHGPVTCSSDTLKGAWEISRNFNLPLQIHLSETEDEVKDVMKTYGKRPVQYLDDLGLINDGLIADHSIHLDDHELECLRKKGVKVVHVPESNMKLGAGIARVFEMIEMGLTVGIGTDGCSSNNNMDIFQEMDTAAKLSKVFPLDPIRLDAKTVIKMATVWGAEVLGLEKQIGTLEVGKQADIIVLDPRSPNLCPIYDPFSAIVYAATGGDVKDVIVNGKVLMKEREFMTLDPSEVMGRVRALAKGIRI
jgi:5-methylthioadenosine/S-adenosylhomocysteine deaminase